MSPPCRDRPEGFRALYAGLCVLAVVLASSGCGKTAGGLTGGSGSSECKPPSMLCGTSCANIASSAEHCGACDMPCPSGDQCIRGACTSTKCPAGHSDCG